MADGEPTTLVMVVDGDREVMVCRLADLGRPSLDGTDPGRTDLSAIDALTRLRLTARRGGRGIRLQGVGPELRSLLDLVGLAELFEGAAPDRAGPCRPGPG